MAARLSRAFLVLALFSTHASGAERRLLEAEDFEGGTLPCTPYFREDAKGWYAREANCRAYGAPGKGLHNGASSTPCTPRTAGHSPRTS